MQQLPRCVEHLLQSPIALGHALGYTGLTEELHGAAWNFVAGRPRSYIEFPRGHYKSTLFSIILPIWHLLRNPAERIMLIGANKTLAQAFLRQIHQHLLGDLIIQGEKIPFASVFPWMAVGRGRNSGYSEKLGLNIKGRSGNNKERSIFTAGILTSTAGRHPTIIIADDLQDEQNSVTWGQREKVWRAYQTLTPLAEDLNCPIYVIGTPWAQFDLAWRLKEELKVPTFRRTIWSGTPQHNGKPPGEVNPELGMTGWPLAPHIMNAEQIQWLTDPNNDKRISWELFSVWYRCVAVPSSEALFDLDIWNGMQDQSIHLDQIEGYEIALVDPACSDEKRTCPSGIVIYRVNTAQELGLAFPNPALNIYTLAGVYEIHGGYNHLWNALRKIAHDPRHKRLRLIAVESVAFQEIVAWVEKGLPNGIRCVPIKGIAKGNGKPRRAMGLQDAILRGRVRRPAHNIPGLDILKTQMLNWPKLDHDDVFDAAALVSMMPKTGDLRPETKQTPQPQTLGWFIHREKDRRKTWIRL